ncbi:RluA family pseudouridine synthase [Chitinasiproducens palmae]|uniref:Pseudouridine synthase n=1 Tax=Chitinasiproducens palmae TaxID=1770053 RepID=A0A1H2PWI1_9BURK|nr:RluA family pseudouridine synthase [Chitinasiproducens palmae]SDV51399.1 ribosomal large subunit pseudouridine synthase D [Chitinasiproducens palmae]
MKSTSPSSTARPSVLADPATVSPYAASGLHSNAPDPAIAGPRDAAVADSEAVTSGVLGIAPPGGDLDEDDEAAATASVEASPIRAQVPNEWAGHRLDKVLARLFTEYSRSRLQDWLEAGRVEIDGRVAGKRDTPIEGATIVVRPTLGADQQAFRPEPVSLEVVFENDALAVIDKPAGLVVHPGAGNWSGTLLNGLLHRYGDAAAALPRAGIVHRLDKDTSGLIVVARTLQAQTDLVRQLQARTVKRQYLALVWGKPPSHGTIDAPIGRDSRDRLRMAVVEGQAGKPARTHFETVAYGAWRGRPVAALRCDLETGRTHQIRVHCRHIGHPLLGDTLYMRGLPGAGAASPIARQALHAWRLALQDPVSGETVHWTSALPDDIVSAADASDLSLPPLGDLR